MNSRCSRGRPGDLFQVAVEDSRLARIEAASRVKRLEQGQPRELFELDIVLGPNHLREQLRTFPPLVAVVDVILRPPLGITENLW